MSSPRCPSAPLRVELRSVLVPLLVALQLQLPREVARLETTTQEFLELLRVAHGTPLAFGCPRMSGLLGEREQAHELLPV